MLDPSTGAPARAAALAAVSAPSAALTDAWATALLVGGAERFEALVERAGALTALLGWEAGGLQWKVKGRKPDIFKEPGSKPAP